MKFKIYSTLILTVLLLSTELFAGGGNRNGTAGATELIIPVGTRGIAMGSSVITSSKGLDALFFNPANLDRADYTTNVFVSNMTHIADISVQYGAISTNIEGFGSIAFDIKALAIGDIEVTTVDNPDGTGSTYSPQVMTIGLTYSRAISDRIAIGITANYISEQIALANASGIAFNVGISYENLANVNGLNFGLVVRNLGTTMSYSGSGLNVQAAAPSLSRPQQYYSIEAAPFDLPASLEIGLGYELGINAENNVTITSLFQSNNFYGDQYKFGAEYEFNNLVFLRGGYSFAPDMDTDYNTFGISGGLGLKYDIGGLNLMVDYAYQPVRYDGLGDNHVFSLGLGF